jgi:hypothetical protein
MIDRIKNLRAGQKVSLRVGSKWIKGKVWHTHCHYHAGPWKGQLAPVARMKDERGASWWLSNDSQWVARWKS